jgi:hypothetical protein
MAKAEVLGWREDRQWRRSPALKLDITAPPGLRSIPYLSPILRFTFFPSLSLMPQGDKSAYTDKQKRQAEHIEESYEKRGVSEDEAEKRAWATVNKTDGGGKKSGSGRKQADDK